MPCCGSVFFRRKAAEEKKGLGWIPERMLCSCKLRLRRASPTVGLPSAHRALLGLRVGFMPAGPRLAATRAMLRVCFFPPPQSGRREERAGADRQNGPDDRAGGSRVSIRDQPNPRFGPSVCSTSFRNPRYVDFQMFEVS